MVSNVSAPFRGPGAAAGALAVRWWPLAVAVLLGLTLVAGVGFAHLPALHDAAHDLRHATAFPCH
jgi:cobalt transporter subunit CbtB